MRIESPCHEDFSKMSKTEAGRHCKACETVVVDFTKMNDNEIKSFMLNYKGESMCIRAKSHQLDTRTKFESFLINIKHFASNRISLSPLRVAVLTAISALLTLSSCFMGKRMDTPIHAYDQPVKDSVKVEKKK